MHFILRHTSTASVVVWQLRRLYIGTALFLVKVKEEDLELTAPLTHGAQLFLLVCAEYRQL